MACLLCDNELTTFSSVNIGNGKICKSCLSKLPALIAENVKSMYDSELQIILASMPDKYEMFSATSSFGDLHIDELHGLFAIAKKLDVDGKPKNNNIFSIYELSEVGIYCKSPKANNHIVCVDVEFSFSLESPSFTKKIIVDRNVKCKTQRADASHVTWEEPETLKMFRTLFTNMLEGGLQRMQNLLCSKTVAAYEIDKARALFMLTEDFEMEDLNRAKRKMLAVYQSDDGSISRESRIIERSYHLLVNEYRNRQKGS